MNLIRRLLEGSAAAFATTVLAASATEPPNIVLVMADDQGWADMAYQGDPRLHTPHFDALAREAVRFDRFYSAAPVCSPTRGSVLTGRTPNRFACFSWGHPIRPQEITIAEALKTAGYRTGHFGKWHLGSVQRGSPASPGANGFDEWVSAPNFFDLDPVLSDRGRARPFKGDTSDITVELALDFIRRSAEQKQRFLAVVWFGSPHAPYEALAADQERYDDLPEKKRHFNAEITAMDRAVGHLRSELRRLGLRDNTVLWYCSDNGALPLVGNPGNARGLKGQIYEGGLLVPALLEWPGMIREPRTIAMPCVTSDIYPTVLDIVGVTMPGQRPLDGVSLLPALRGGPQERSKPVGFWHNSAVRGRSVPAKAWMDELLADQARGVEPADPVRLALDAGKIGSPVPYDQFPGHAAWIAWPWKLHRRENPETRIVSWELYQLVTDPSESHALAPGPSNPGPIMQRDLEAWLAGVARSLNGTDYL